MVAGTIQEEQAEARVEAGPGKRRQGGMRSKTVKPGGITAEDARP
jgi:hypothetical protein